MKKYICIFLVFISIPLFPQGTYKYWIGFTDKKNNSYTISQPSTYLSERAIQRRNKQNISITENDLPVTAQYIDSIRNSGFTIYNVSKWMNGVIIGDTIVIDIAKLDSISFIKEVKLVAKPKILKNAVRDTNSSMKSLKICSVPQSYGPAKKQIEIMNGHCLHQMGYRGEGMLIAVLDAGFFQTDSFPAFDSLWKNNQVIAMRDFVNPQRDFFSTHTHGMAVLSIIGGNVPDMLIGTAPKADFALVITEDPDTEYPVEEYNWACGAEFADSLGADIINSSLGYSNFDDTIFNHAFSDMNGETSPCARAAKIAASKGMIVVVSAGNEGEKTWNHIVTPADCKNCLTLGAVDSLRHYATFSSPGPSSDGRIKPDISTMGDKTYVQNWDGKYKRGSGTSYSAPLAAGMVACLWQAFPDRNVDDIMYVVRESGSMSIFPNDSIGYGIPDFDKAFTILNNSRKSYYQQSDIDLSPNPFRQQLHIAFNAIIEDPFTIEFLDIKGVSVFKTEVAPIYSCTYDLMNTELLPRGVLICKINIRHSVYTFKIIKA